MFIKSQSPAPAGTLLKLECEADAADKIRGVGRVVWLRSEPNEHGPAGMGVKFVKLEAGSKELISELVERLAEAGIEARNMSAPPETRRGSAVASPASTTDAGQTRSPVPAARGTAPSASPSPIAPRSPTPSAGRPALATAAQPAGSVAPAPSAVASTAAGLGPASGPAPARETNEAQPSAAGSAAVSDAPSAFESAQPLAAGPTAAKRGEATAARADAALSSAARLDAADEVTAAPVSVPPTAPRRSSALRVWLGIAAGVAILLAIIFADEGSGTPPAPAARSGERAAIDQAQNPASPPVVAPPATSAASPTGPASEATPAAALPANEATPAAAPAPIDAPAAQPEVAAEPSTPPPTAATTQAPSAPAPAEPSSAPAANAKSYVLDFVSRPVGATISVGERNVVAPGQIELGSEIPDRVKVLAKKPGFQQSSAWIERASFEHVSGTLWRRVVYMTLPAEQPGAAPAPVPTPTKHH
jgi:hypothetical protein